MIAAQGFAEVMKATGQIEPLVQASANMFAGNKTMAAFAMLMVGLLITMGIGSSFSTLPIITAIYVPLCVSLGFSPMATVAICAIIMGRARASSWRVSCLNSAGE